MSRTSQFALVMLVVLSFALSAALLFTATQWLRTPLAVAATLSRVARHSVRVAHEPQCDAAVRIEVAGEGSSHFSYSSDDDGDAYALIETGDDDFVMNIGGHSPDKASLMRGDARPVLWFVRDGYEWACRDRATVAEAREILRPLRELGHEMGQVGGRMGEIGGKQGRIGGKLGELGGRLARLTVRRASLEDDDPARARLSREIDDVRAEMKALSVQMRRVDAQNESASLGERMRALSARNKDLAERVRPRMRALIDRAVRERLAERLAIGA